MCMVEASDFSPGSGALGRREKRDRKILRLEPWRSLATPRICASIDSLSAPAYTHVSFLQAGEAGKAVQIGRGPATVIG
jgi:hypothetical protein